MAITPAQLTAHNSKLAEVGTALRTACAALTAAKHFATRTLVGLVPKYNGPVITTEFHFLPLPRTPNGPQHLENTRVFVSFDGERTIAWATTVPWETLGLVRLDKDPQDIAAVSVQTLAYSILKTVTGFDDAVLTAALGYPVPADALQF